MADGMYIYLKQYNLGFGEFCELIGVEHRTLHNYLDRKPIGIISNSMIEAGAKLLEDEHLVAPVLEENCTWDDYQRFRKAKSEYEANFKRLFSERVHL